MPQKDTLKRIGRVLTMVAHLKDGPMNLKDMIRKFKVDKRTVQRDLAIMNRVGFFTQSDGAGTYTLVDGVRLGNRKVTNEQYNALNTLAAYARNLGTGLSGVFEKMFLHITGYTPFGTFIMPIMPRVLSDTLPHIKDIEYAIEWGKELQIEYQADDEPLKTRTVCPLKVLICDSFSYLFTFNKAKPGEFRKYRLDRIVSLKVLDNSHFTEPEDAEAAINSARSIWGAMSPRRRTIDVKLRVESHARDYFRRQELVAGQKLTELEDGALLYEAKVCQFWEITPYILRWIPHVTVLEPAQLKEEVLAQVKTYAEKQTAMRSS
jgi:predicted DNA-binding transcriptional regulator YafY